MRMALAALAMPPDHVLVDGLPVFHSISADAIIDGDCYSLSIAASVIQGHTRPDDA